MSDTKEQAAMRVEFEAWCGTDGRFGLGKANGNYHAVNTHNAWVGWQAALAARQPGVQEPVGQVVEETNNDSTVCKGVLFATYILSDNYKPGALLYTAPSEQGIDLGQFRTQVAELLRMEFDLEVADPEDHRHDDGASEAELVASKIAALISQRDAAPGMGND